MTENPWMRIVGDIARERERQDAKWGSQRRNPSLYWLGILMEEVGETAREVIEAVASASLRRELVQVAAVAVCWLEALDRSADADAEEPRPDQLRALVAWRDERQAEVDSGAGYPSTVRTETYLQHTGLLLEEVERLGDNDG